ncbi:MAG: dTDP-4-dehydrorhamnose 3,5-epimerase family protein [Patescibacteria group bacterium]
MTKAFDLEDLDSSVRSKIYTQDYTPKAPIEGVKIIKLVNHVGEDGDFSEIMKLDSHGEVEGLPGFKLAQINRTKLGPQSVKAWHLHLKQDEIWYVSPHYEVFVGLWDIRQNSRTRGATMRFTLGGGNSQLLFIPRGVAHGTANFTYELNQLYYFVNEKFNPQDPDEKRLPWDALGANFWQPERD